MRFFSKLRGFENGDNFLKLYLKSQNLLNVYCSQVHHQFPIYFYQLTPSPIPRVKSQEHSDHRKKGKEKKHSWTFNPIYLPQHADRHHFIGKIYSKVLCSFV